MDREASIDRIISDLDAVTKQVSSQVRALAYGVLAVDWLLIAGGKDAPAIDLTAHRSQLLVIAGLCVLTMIFDLAQYIVGYFLSNAALTAVEANAGPEQPYDKDDPVYKARKKFFWAKVLTAVAAGVWLLILLAFAAVR